MDYRDNRSYNGGAANGGINVNPRPSYGKPKSSGGARKPATPKGHDAVLSGIQNSTETITLLFLDGETISGRLMARDKFTLTVEDGGNTTTFYKHAIKGFYKGS